MTLDYYPGLCKEGYDNEISGRVFAKITEQKLKNI